MEELEARALRFEEQQKRIDLRFDLLVRTWAAPPKDRGPYYPGELFGYPPPEEDDEELSEEETALEMEAVFKRFQAAKQQLGKTKLTKE
jgi:hypothetical protein